jgi:hypothetical protein
MLAVIAPHWLQGGVRRIGSVGRGRIVVWLRVVVGSGHESIDSGLHLVALYVSAVSRPMTVL